MSAGVSGGGATRSAALGTRGENCVTGWACAAWPSTTNSAISSTACVRKSHFAVMAPPSAMAHALAHILIGEPVPTSPEYALCVVGGEDLVEAPEQILRLLDCRLTLADPQRQRVALATDGVELLPGEAGFTGRFVGRHSGATRDPRGRSVQACGRSPG